MNTPTYEDYKKLLLEWYSKVEWYKREAMLLSKAINDGIDVIDNTNKLEELWIAINFEVNRWYAIMNDALWDWYGDQLRSDNDLPHWDTWDIILNEEAFNKQMDEEEKKFFVTMSEIMDSARPFNKEKLEAENKFKEKKKKNNRTKNRAAKACRKKNK